MNESTNIWDYKPSWCQPWSIILTGASITFASWLVLHTTWITIGVAGAIALWWIYFLIIYPKAFAEYLEAQKDELNTQL
ncbi:hypothetical protein I4641_03560 [Waterburya agarophytonicola K14]|uniref:DUF6737 domain-containing protein n=1 Tax=Waterburya agarophytonicola KI4 TaxID=2874699 RepID=A0A964BMH1_9CYAN|nr:DUF6737 family protein [Waterburya agarophytonicola]MCC0176055.1 hypothetical protein [Waterburya agarophytonicola KI4]